MVEGSWKKSFHNLTSAKYWCYRKTPILPFLIVWPTGKTRRPTVRGMIRADGWREMIGRLRFSLFPEKRLLGTLGLFIFVHAFHKCAPQHYIRYRSKSQSNQIKHGTSTYSLLNRSKFCTSQVMPYLFQRAASFSHKAAIMTTAQSFLAKIKRNLTSIFDIFMTEFVTL
jgi:hypothetical protein